MKALLIFFIFVFVNNEINDHYTFNQNSDNLTSEEMKLKEYEDNINKVTILLGCSILGKFSQENEKVSKKLNKAIDNFLWEYELDEQQAFNMVNLLLLKHCTNSLPLEIGKKLISNTEFPSRGHMRYLNIVGVSSYFESHKDKDKLLDDLDALNNNLKDLSNKLDELKYKKQLIEAEIKEKTSNEQVKSEIQNRNKDNIEKSKMQNEEVTAKKIFKKGEQIASTKEPKRINKIEFENNKQSNNKEITLHDQIIYFTGKRFFQLCSAFPEIVLVFFVLIIFTFFNLCKKRTKKKLSIEKA